MAKRSSRWRSFDDARVFAQTLGLTTQKAYEDWARENGHALGMPVAPHKFYAEFTSYPDFLSFDAAPRKKKTSNANVLSFADARIFMHQFGLKSQRGFETWSKNQRPAFIPSNPRDFYGAEWTTMDDFLGYKKSYRPFLEACEYARSKGFKLRMEWLQFAATSEFPSDIPIHPAGVYRNQGWSGWGDFLGFYTTWNRLSIISFLDSLKPIISDLSELDLYLILSRNGMLRRRLNCGGAGVLRGLTGLKKPEDIDKAKENLADAIESETGKVEKVVSPIFDTELPTVFPEKINGECASQLRHLKSLEHLFTIDRLVEARVSDDSDVIEMMIEGRVNTLWQHAMDGDEHSIRDQVLQMEGGKYFNEIRCRFMNEYDLVQQLEIPQFYAFSDSSGIVRRPNLMQLLTAYRLKTRKRIGNWSGVGAGKTNAAILASAVVDAHFTVILAANSTVSNWGATVRRSFDANVIHVHDEKPRRFCLQPGKRNFVVVNYESFQQDWSADLISLLAQQSCIDLIVFDEVQFTRQRYESESQKSERRKQVERLVQLGAQKNPDLRVLAMSATPVVNNLREAVKLLELLLPEHDFSAVPVQPCLANAVGIHILLREHGIRSIPQYEIKLVEKSVSIDGQELLHRLMELKPQQLLQMEQTLLEAKLRHLAQWVRRGTLIYTSYKTGIVEPLTTAVEKLGFRVQYFTGDEQVVIEEFVRDFKNNRVDVLIGTAPVGTGVDGLQFVLDRIVFITLPWSHAEYKQIVGRLWRQGSAFESVEVIIPQVTLRQQRVGPWSWDEQRLRLIEYKQTLADAALDGVVPEGKLPSREEMQKRSLEALQVWAQNVAKGILPGDADQEPVTSPSSPLDPTPVP
jgi:superfamily II DNA or RNA helicase